MSWSQALTAVAGKFSEVKARGGKFGVIGSNHTTNEENYYLQKFAREGAGHEQHRPSPHGRCADAARCAERASERAGHRRPICTTTKAALVIGADLAQQHPLLAFQIRANYRHHQAHVYTVTQGPVREDKYAAGACASRRRRRIGGVESLRGELTAEPELVIVFGDTIKGDGVRELVAFGDSLGIPVKYVCLVDYSNSRGASDMGLLPDLLPAISRGRGRA